MKKRPHKIRAEQSHSAWYSKCWIWVGNVLNRHWQKSEISLVKKHTPLQGSQYISKATIDDYYDCRAESHRAAEDVSRCAVADLISVIHEFWRDFIRESALCSSFSSFAHLRLTIAAHPFDFLCSLAPLSCSLSWTPAPVHQPSSFFSPHFSFLYFSSSIVVCFGCSSVLCLVLS